MLPKTTPTPVPVTPFASQRCPAAVMYLAPSGQLEILWIAVPIAVFAATVVAHEQLPRMLKRRRRAP